MDPNGGPARFTVDSSMPEDLAAFVDAVRAVVDDLDVEDRAVVAARLDLIDVEFSSHAPAWDVISVAVAAICRLATAGDPDRWPAVIRTGQAVLDDIHSG